MAKSTTENEEFDDVELEAEEDEGQDWGDWNADDEEEDDPSSDLLCLFCDSKYVSRDALFEHCESTHRFDFRGVRKTLDLDFYGSFKLINYIRAQVAENRCWSCGIIYQSKHELHDHLHKTFSFEGIELPWGDDKYLKPFMQEDPLLYSFCEDIEPEDEDNTSVDKVSDVINFERVHIDDDDALEAHLHGLNTCDNGRMDVASASNTCIKMINPSEKVNANDVDVKNGGCSSDRRSEDDLGIYFAKAVASEVKNVNKSYFRSYSSYGIHREMISDKVRTDAYRLAISNNPSLLHGACVLDLGCGTGILSLFAAQAGASSVIAIEASDKMAAVATEIAKDNGLLWNGSPNDRVSQCTGVIRVVQGMVEELDISNHIQPHSIDVIVSEWMGYCLLYESMLSSVLFARDHWLKPGGAMLPDTATMFVAGFGRGGTSIPFWENVYGFNMSYIGDELVEDAARIPIVDVVDSCDIVTGTVVLQSFDLLKMTPDEMDFTSSIELEPLPESPTKYAKDSLCETTWCYGVVLWFETGFTSRFCKEMPIVLSTSPHGPTTHWAQTILTFKEPIALALGRTDADGLAAVGTDACPAVKISPRISIARSTPHRCIDISLEIAGISPDGRKRSWPVQIFNLS